MNNELLCNNWNVINVWVIGSSSYNIRRFWADGPQFVTVQGAVFLETYGEGALLLSILMRKMGSI